MSKALSILLVSLCLFSCGPNILSQVSYKANFKTSDIEQIETLIHKIGKEWDLTVFEKDKSLLKSMSEGKEEFLMTMEFDNTPVIVVTNISHESRLTVAAADFGGMPATKLEDLTNEILASIEAEFGVKFTKENTTQK